MFEFSAQSITMLIAAIVVGAVTASRSRGGLAGAAARGAVGLAVRGVIALLILGGIYVFMQSDRGGRALGTKDPLEHAKVGDCVAGSTQDDARVVDCASAFADTRIVQIFRDTTPGAAMTEAACGGVEAADSAFTVTDLSGGANHAVAYCTKTR